MTSEHFRSPHHGDQNFMPSAAVPADASKGPGPALDDEVYAGLQKSAREHLWMHFTRHSTTGTCR